MDNTPDSTGRGVGATRVAGVGGDGELYGVTRVCGGDGAYMRRPCAECPWRKDAPVGRFPAQAFRESARTAYDGAWEAFACHMAGKAHPTTCAGFLLQNADNNFGVRMAFLSGRIDPAEVTDGGVDLYPSYRAMAVANGVSEDDPALLLCRDNERGSHA